MRKLATIATATVFALSSTFALAQGGGGAGSPGVDKTNNSTSRGTAGTGAMAPTTGAATKSGSGKTDPKNSTSLGDKTGEKLRGAPQ
jgi:hypothetical protein